ncbi:MAG TPA: FAD-binding domain-containing protein [Methylophilus sp.]|nr:FAD-binding domain-containing protein [Methylophilus sp.]HQQ33203.1 FAD-binding domain-containing protein [Methylophilus sp.]
MANVYKLTLPHDRAERLQYMRRMFPQATGAFLSEKWHGGRGEAIKRLNTFDARAYGRNRNFLNGAVSHLSPYFRHGCLTLKEASDNLRSRFGSDAIEIVGQLAWRDYWRRVWYLRGDSIFSDIEPAKVPLGDKLMPDFIRQGITGVPCMDGIIRDLLHEGYVHNHARLWFAAYVIHWLKVDWREAADWFESFALDGDKASNHLSWQWVASLFSSKPYYFNKENLARFSGEKYCANCKIKCPFDASYEVLNERLFGQAKDTPAKVSRIMPPPKAPISAHQAVAVFVHDEMLSAANPLLHKPIPKIFVFDDRMYGKWPLKRLQFVADCLNEMPNVEVWQGDTYSVLNERGIGQVVSQDTPNRQFKLLLETFNPLWQPEAKFIHSDISEKRLMRYSRYWEKAGQELFGPDFKQPN